MCIKIQGQKIDTKKDIQDLPTKNSCKKSFTVANFDTLPRIANFFFSMEILEWKHLCVNYTCEKFQVQKTHKKNDIPNLPIGVVVRNKGKNRFTTSNFDSLPRA